MWVDQPDDGDSEFVYHRRTIPPIPGVTQGRSSPTLVAYRRERESENERYTVDKKKEAEEETKKEIELQVQMVGAGGGDTYSPFTLPGRTVLKGSSLRNSTTMVRNSLYASVNKNLWL